MVRTTIVAGVAIAACMLALAQADQLPPQAAYDLQEKCGRDAREWFRAFFGNGESQSATGSQIDSYTNHYSVALGRCFAVVTAIVSTKDKKTGSARMSRDLSLIDVNENRTIGSFFQFLDERKDAMCGVAQVSCANEEEWTKMLKPYMEL